MLIDHFPIKFSKIANRFFKIENETIIETEIPSDQYSPDHIDSFDKNSLDTSKKKLITYSRGLAEGIVEVLEFQSGLTLIIGNNGSGKSTLLMTMSRIIGTINENSELKPIPIYLPQDISNFFWQRTVIDEFSRSNPPLWLLPLSNMSPFELSLGQQKKLAIEIAFTQSRPVAIDEPGQGLGPLELDWFYKKLFENIRKTWIIIASNNEDMISTLKPYAGQIINMEEKNYLSFK